MRHFNISYTSYFNRTHDRVGHLYQGRYKSLLIDADSYLMEVSRYVHLNPIRIKKNESLPEKELLTQLRNYQWSSYPDYIRKTARYPWLSREDLICYFGGDSVKGQKAYTRFVERGLSDDIPNPLEKGKGHGIIGDELFIKEVTDRFVTPKPKREVPALKSIERYINPARILETVAAVTDTDQSVFLSRGYKGIERGLAMELLYRHGGMTQREIGELIGVDYSTISVARKRFRTIMDQDTSLRGLVASVQERFIQE
jgi:putative transposase